MSQYWVCHNAILMDIDLVFLPPFLTTITGRWIRLGHDIHHREYHCHGVPCWWYELWLFWIRWGDKYCIIPLADEWIIHFLFINVNGWCQGFYRNHMEEVIRFFESHHKVFPILYIHVLSVTRTIFVFLISFRERFSINSIHVHLESFYHLFF